MARIRGPMRRVMAASVLATSVAIATGSVPAFAGTDPGTRVWQVGGSNMGECSAYLGGLQVRDDVNAIIRTHGDVLGIDNPGSLFHIRAQQPVSLAPQQECLPRSL